MMDFCGATAFASGESGSPNTSEPESSLEVVARIAAAATAAAAAVAAVDEEAAVDGFALVCRGRGKMVMVNERND